MVLVILTSRSPACGRKRSTHGIRRNKLGRRFLYKLKSNISYIETLNTLDNREDQNYEDNERSIKSTGVYLRRMEQRYLEEQKEIEEMNQTQ